MGSGKLPAEAAGEMNEMELNSEIVAKMPFRMPQKFTLAAVVFIIIGIIGFALGATGPQPTRVWQIFLVNMLFWSGIAQAGIVFSAIMQVTNGKWGAPIKRLSEGISTFLPISFVLFFLLIAGRHYIFTWLDQPVAVEKSWLNFPFLFTRDLIGIIILGVLGIAYLYFSLRPDVGLMQDSGYSQETWLKRILIKTWSNFDEERKRSNEMLSIISVVFIVMYAFIFSLLSVDLVMSLDPHWYSTLFGGYFFISNIYITLAFLAVLSIIMRKYYGLEDYITIGHLHDMGKLMFGFCILTGDFLWSQYLVIWYGNVQHESSFILLRVFSQPWRNLSIFVMTVAILIPFLALLPKWVKRNPKRLFVVAMVILVAMWFERFLMIVPSLWKEGTFPLGWIEASVTLGFFGAVMLAFFVFMKHFPILPLSDPKLKKGYNIRTY
jgi:hypothetical protein